jgi:hypothetical protein
MLPDHSCPQAVLRRRERVSDDAVDAALDEEFHPRGTIAIVAMFVATLILLWLSIYLILIARGVTV